MAPITRLLSDLPGSADAFGSHSRVAGAIEEMIDSEDGGHAIALEGSWGSGKSTIVKLLQSALKDQVFVFDAWAHEGDPLRRVFLEKLFQHCQPKLTKTKQAEWTRRCANLRARERTDEKREIPQLSWAALLIATLLLLSPMALLVLNSWLRATTTEWWHYLGLIYPLIALIPVAAAILRCCRQDAGEAVALVVTRRIGRTTTTTKETPEPTSIEFETFFSDLLTDAIGDSHERLLIVVDNLDRVLAQHALATWSTLRVFVERMSAGHDRWCNRVWLLVPYDKPSMDRLWAANGGTAAGGDVEEERARPAHKPAAFLDKTFQIRFEVPPLVLADWKEYLVALLQEAFPDHVDLDERQRVYRLSALLAEQKNRPPTPRHLKLYVNDIGALRRQHGDAIPLHHMAYLTILRRQEVDVRLGLVAGTIPDPTFGGVLGDTVEDDLAALLFNTDDIEKARDLLLRQPILEALGSGDEAKLLELASRRGFWPLAETVLPEAPLAWGDRPEAACNAAKVVLNCDLANSTGHPEAGRSVRSFARAISQSVAWRVLDAGIGEGIAATLNLAGSEDVSRALFERVLSNPIAEQEDADVEERATQWVRGLLHMLQAAADLKHARCYVKIDINCEPEVLVRVLAAFREEDGGDRFWRFLSSAGDAKKLLAAIAPEGVDKPWEFDKCAAMEVCLHSQIKFPWPEFASKCHELLRGEAVSPPEVVARLIQALRQVAPNVKKATAIWQQLATGGHLLHHFNACREAEHAAPGAALFREIILHVQIAKAAPAFANAPQGLELLKTFIAQPRQHAELLDAVYDILVSDSGEELLQRLIEHKAVTASLLVTLIELLVERSQVAAVLGSRFFVGAWQHLRGLPGLGSSVFDELLSELVRSGGLLSHLTKTTFSPSDSALFRRLLVVGGASDASFCEWLAKGMLSVACDEWLPELRSGGEGLRLLLDYRQHDQNLLLGHALSDALESFGGEVACGEKESGTLHVEEVKGSIEALTRDRRMVLGKELLDVVTNIQEGIEEGTFTVFGEVLATAIATGENPTALRRVLTPIIQEQQIGAGVWMADLFESNPELLSRFPPEDVQDLKDRALATLDDATEEFSHVAERLRRALGLSRPGTGASEDDALEGT